MLLTNNSSIQEVLFFPQMKPETQTGPSIDLNDDEKSILEILKKEQKMLLNDLKSQSGLSNKKWDKSIKSLSKNNLTKVEKSEEGLFVILQ